VKARSAITVFLPTRISQQGDCMTEEQLLLHALRCARLAETCLDPQVARKLLALASDYRAFAEELTGRTTARLREDTPLEPEQRPRLAAS
jgi:hypothetical protein